MHSIWSCPPTYKLGAIWICKTQFIFNKNLSKDNTFYYVGIHTSEISKHADKDNG